MERIIDIDERIRRAEELYNKRKMQGGVRVSTSNVNTNNRKSYSLFKKLFLRITACLIIYAVFYIIKNSGFFFSENLINKTKKLISHDSNLGYVYSNTEKMMNDKIFIQFQKLKTSFIYNNINKNNENINKENIKNENINNENINNEISKKNREDQQNEIVSQISPLNEEKIGIGGPKEIEDEKKVVENSNMQISSVEKNQMEIDADFIKKNVRLTKPLSGIVTSRFGTRKATEIVSANHEGIDIGADKGTKIYAAMEGKVVNVSNYGDYGKHLSIKNGEITTLYAHCNIINVKIGQFVRMGEEIAEVGTTGRTTGPHLHFEIQRDKRVINPELILNF